jgi:serine/threonine protein kinase
LHVIPEKIGKYRIMGPLGQGSTGVVYQAEHEETQQKAALKVVPVDKFASAEARDKFVEEARAAAEVSHPNLRQLYEVGEAGSDLYLAMEHLEGSTLRALLVSGPVELASALAWGAELAEGLAAAHEAGVAHGELVPGKVFLTKDGGVKLLDAGLWRLALPGGVDLSLESNLRVSKLTPAMVAALAPEQIKGAEPTASSDVFSLGTLLYQMVTGQQPTSPVDTMQCVLGRTPPLAGELIEGAVALDPLLARALAKDPKQRRTSAKEIAAGLRAAAAGEPLPAGVAEEMAAEAAGRTTSRLWWAIGIVVLLLVLWYAYLALMPR